MRRLSAIACLLCILLCARNAPCDRPIREGRNKAEAERFVWPPYQTLRYEEDYRPLFTRPDLPAPPRNIFDRLKRIIISRRNKVGVSLGGQERFRYEGFNNFLFGSSARSDDDFYFLHRHFLWVSLQAGPYVRFFGTGKVAHVEDRDLPGGSRAVDRDSIDLLDGFVEVRLPGTGDLEVLVRAGRQQLLFDKQVLVSPLDWSNTRRSWDGGLIRLKKGNWIFDAFYTLFAPVKKDSFNDPDEDHRFWGFHGTGRGVLGSPVSVSTYFYGRHLRPAGPDVDRYTWGARLETPLPGTPLQFATEGGYQFGEVGRSDINAFFVLGEGTLKPSGVPCRPSLTLGFDYASGDRRPAAGDSETFDQLYPLGHAYLGYIDAVGRKNIMDARLRAALHPTKATKLQFDWHNFWRAERNDALYNAAGKAIRTGGSGTDRFVGIELDWTFSWKATHNVSVLLGYSRFFAGDFLEDTGSSDDVDFWYAQLQFTY